MRRYRHLWVAALVGASGLAWADGVAIMKRTGPNAQIQYYGTAAPSGFLFTPANNATSTNSRLAIGDISGDGADDIVVGPSSEASSSVYTYRGSFFGTVHSFSIPTSLTDTSVAITPSWANPDPQITVGAGPGDSPLVQVYSAGSDTLIANFFAFDTSFKGGVTVANGDVDGDGVEDFVCGQATGGPMVRVYSGATLGLIQTLTPFGPTYTGGVRVASGDINGDGVDDLVASTATGPGQLKVISGGGQDTVLLNLMPYGSTDVGGVSVAVSDHDRDGRDDLVTGTMGTGPCRVKVILPAKGNQVLYDFVEFFGYSGGCIVGGSPGRPPTTAVTQPVAFDQFPGNPATLKARITCFSSSKVPVCTRAVALTSDAKIKFNSTLRGTGTMLVKVDHCLSRRVAVNFTGGTTTLPLLPVLNGDIDGDDSITVFDYSVLSNYFDVDSSSPNWLIPGPDGFAPFQADLDGDGANTVFDYSILSDNFDKSGDGPP